MDALATLVSMVEIPEGVWTRPLEIEQSYEKVHKRKIKASAMTIKEKEVPRYYDIMKFLELGAYQMVPIRENVVPLGWWQLNISYVGDNSIEDPMMAYTFVVRKGKKLRE